MPRTQSPQIAPSNILSTAIFPARPVANAVIAQPFVPSKFGLAKLVAVAPLGILVRPPVGLRSSVNCDSWSANGYLSSSRRGHRNSNSGGERPTRDKTDSH